MRVTSNDILNGPIGPVLRRMITPMVIGIFALMLFQAVDTYFLSLLGTAELAAISFTFPVTFAVVNLSIGLGIALSVVVGQAIGEGRHARAARMTTEALLLAVLVVALVAGLGLLTVDPLFRMLGASAPTLLLIHEYIDIWYIFVALLVLPQLCNSAIRATGDTKWPSILMMAAGLVNVVFDPILIFGFGPIPALGMRGAAWATVLSWAFASLAAGYLLIVREKLLVLWLPSLRELLSVWGRLLTLAMPISLANMLNPIAIAILTALIARHGEHAVAAMGVGGRIEAFALIVAFAVTAGLSPYMAQNIGARKPGRADASLRLSIRFIVLFQCATYVVLFLSAGWIARVFSDDPRVIETATLYLRMMPIGAVFYAIVIVLNTAYNSHRKSGRTLILSLLRVLLFVTPLAVIGERLYGPSGIFAGAIIGNAVAVLVGWHFYRRLQRLPVAAPA